MHPRLRPPAAKLQRLQLHVKSLRTSISLVARHPLCWAGSGAMPCGTAARDAGWAHSSSSSSSLSIPEASVTPWHQGVLTGGWLAPLEWVGGWTKAANRWQASSETAADIEASQKLNPTIQEDTRLNPDFTLLPTSPHLAPTRLDIAGSNQEERERWFSSEAASQGLPKLPAGSCS